MPDQAGDQAFVTPSDHRRGTSIATFQQAFLRRQIELSFRRITAMTGNAFVLQSFSHIGAKDLQSFGPLGSMFRINSRSRLSHRQRGNGQTDQTGIEVRNSQHGNPISIRRDFRETNQQDSIRTAGSLPRGLLIPVRVTDSICVSTDAATSAKTCSFVPGIPLESPETALCRMCLRNIDCNPAISTRGEMELPFIQTWSVCMGRPEIWQVRNLTCCLDTMYFVPFASAHGFQSGYGV